MSPFNEANTTEQFIIDLLTQLPGLPWTFVKHSALGRKENEAIVEPMVREALINLNPEIKADPAKADEVLYHLNAVLLEGKTNLVKANEQFMEWLRGDKSMPFGTNHEHIPIKLIDFEHPAQNRFVITQQYTYKPDTKIERRMDIVLLVNGFPLVIGEVKTPVRPSVSWVDGVKDFIEDYWKTVPALFVPNVCCFASEGKTYRFATPGSDYLQWAPWRETIDRNPNPFEELRKALVGMLNPETVLDLLISFSVFPVNRKGRKEKVIARYPQYEAARQIVQRVVEGRIKRGLIWHFQGSGKSLLIVFAAMLLKANPALKNPTVIVVVDRKDLDIQIGSDFDAADVPNTVKANSRDKLEQLLVKGSRQIIITTIHKFAEIPVNANTSDNIIVLVDEAHRTQEGDLGLKMRAALPNAFLFGLTGTPIARRDRNTFAWFGAEEDTDSYLNRYTYQQAVFDEAILPVHFVPRPVELDIDQEAIDAGFEEIAQEAELDTVEKAELSKRGGRLSHLLTSPACLTAVADHITQHFLEQIEPGGFKGMVVMYDRLACTMMYYLLAQRLGAEALEVIMITQEGDLTKWQDDPALKQNNITVQAADYQRWQKLDKDADALEKLLNRYRDSSDPLKLLIVTNKLLTGFNAPICKAMYLNKPLRDHTLLQAICRTNRLYPNKYNGLILDYLGVFDEPKKALDFDLKRIQGAIASIKQLRDEFEPALNKALTYFPNVDRTLTGYAGLLTAQECLKTDDQRDQFGADYRVVSRLWEILSPDPTLESHRQDYTWLTHVYQSIQPVSGIGKLIWQSLGPKTLALIYDNVMVEDIRDDLETLILDANLVQTLTNEERDRKGQSLITSIERRLRNHLSDPRFEALGSRLERLKNQYELDVEASIRWLKELLEIAREVVQTEQETQVELIQDCKTVLTALFEEYKVAETPGIIGRIVEDIDQVVKVIRFDGWQNTSGGEREVQKVLRQTLYKYKLHKEKDLFDRAYAYIRQYY